MAASLERIIEKALAKHSRGSLREQWDGVKGFVDNFFEFAELMGDSSPVAPKVQATNAPVLVMPSPQETAELSKPVAPPVRIITPGESAPEGEIPVEHWTSIDSLQQEVMKVMPLTIALDLPGFTKPLELQRKIVPFPATFDRVKMLRLMYTADGGPDGPSVLVKTSDTEVDRDSILGEISKAAAAQYSPQERKVAPQTRFVPPPSIEEMERAMRDNPLVNPKQGQDMAVTPGCEIRTDRTGWAKYAKE
jgi:hypothetical protein